MAEATIQQDRSTTGELVAGKRDLIWVVTLGVAFLGAHLPLLVKLGSRLWQTEHYQHFPLILAGAALLAWKRWQKVESVEPGRAIWRFLLVVPSVLTLGVAVLLDSPWLCAIAAMMSLWAVIYVLGGRGLLRGLFPAWLFLWLAIPLPLGLDTQLIVGLQHLATNWASGALDAFGYRHLVAGVVLELPGRSFLVEEACSGINSMYAAISCTMFYLLWKQRPVVRSLVLIFATVFWVLVANATRVTLVTILSIQWNLPLTEGWRHDMVGVLVFATALTLVWSTDRLLLFFLPLHGRMRIWARLKQWPQALRKRRKPGRKKRSSTSDDDRRDARERPAEQSATVKQPRRPRSGPQRVLHRAELSLLILIFASLAGVQILWAANSGHGPKTSGVSRKPVTFDKKVLPQQLGPWKQTSYDTTTRDEDDPNGQHSQIWQYINGDLVAVVSVDGPFIGWHNLSGCLEGQGWSVQSSTNSTYRETGENLSGGFTEMTAVKGVSRRGFIVYGVFDTQHRPVSPIDTYVRFRAVRRFPAVSELMKKLGGEVKEQRARDDSRTYQIQVFVESYVPLSQDQQAEVRELFHAVRHQFTDSKDVP